MLDEKFKLTRNLTSVLVVFTIVFLLFAFKPMKVLIWIFGLIVFWSILFFGTKLVQKKNLLESEKEKDTKLPKAMNPESLKLIIEKRINSFEYRNHVKRFGAVIPHASGKNLIYQFDIDFLYPDKNLGEGCVYLVNAHYPKIRYAILRRIATTKEIRFAANSLSTNPSEEPNMEKRTEIDLDRGKQIIYEKKIKPKKKEVNPQEKKTEDLA